MFAMSVAASEGTARAGRPRDRQLSARILATTRDLVTRHGYDEVTTEMIARTAGIGKQSLYRRWPGKAELVLEAFTSSAREQIDDALPRGSMSRRLTAFLRLTFEALQVTAPAIRSLMATAQRDAAFHEQFKLRLIEPRRHALRRVLAESERHVSAENLDAAVVALFGALWYRLLLDEPLDVAFAGRLVNIVLDGVK